MKSSAKGVTVQFVFQIFLGSAFLLASAVLHISILAYGIPFLERFSEDLKKYSASMRRIMLLCAGVLIILSAHTVTIWLWAATLHRTGDFSDFAESFYFSTVTYTTLGYGDIVLDPSARIFASFAAIAGLLTFGISAAFLVGLLVRLMPDVFDRDDGSQ